MEKKNLNIPTLKAGIKGEGQSNNKKIDTKKTQNGKKGKEEGVGWGEVKMAVNGTQRK